MLTRVRNVLARLRSGDAPAVGAATPEPWPSFDGEVAASGGTTLEWVRQRRAVRSLYVDIDDAMVRRTADRHPDIAAATIASADRVLRHEFNLLGSGPFVPRDPDRATGAGYQAIDWRLDPIRRVRFPGGFHHRSWNPDTMRPANGDIKLPWELGRCQHFFALGQAFRLTSHEGYAREIVDEIVDFTSDNPVSEGVQWVCTMDVGLRAISWTIGLALAARSTSASDDEWLTAYRSLFDHGAFIERNLENKYEVTSNHFLSNVVGLFYLSVALSGLPSAERWRARTREWLDQEMRTQVLADGADYESSVPYHRLVTELFLGPARLARHVGEALPAAYEGRLKQMVEFLVAVMRPDGLMPQIGDADDGRLHVLTDYGTWQPQDARHLLGPAGRFFGVDAWLALSGEAGEWEASWWGFPSASETPPPAVAIGSAHFPHAGVTVLRDGAHYAIVTNGKVGTSGFGNHKHCDQLAFEYHLGGVALLVDPGSHVYTSDPDSRNRFRSTRSHNTLMIDDVEQNEIRPEWLFRMFERAVPEHLHWAAGPDVAEYVGRHRGYTRLDAPVIHERRIVLRRADGALLVDDHVDGVGEHRLAWHFHCAPGVAVVSASDHMFELAVGDTRALLELPGDLIAKVHRASYSPSYGILQPCMAIDATTHARIDGRRSWAFSVTPVTN